MHRLILASVTAALVGTGCTSFEPGTPVTTATGPTNQFRHIQSAVTDPNCTVVITPERELLIRDLLVVEDPVRSRWSGQLVNPSDGAWSFGRLMTSMAGTQNPSTFVRTWLASWEANQTINTFPVPTRPMKQRVTDPWLALNGGTSLDLTRAPFRLLAIVNRLDLADLPNGSAGEGRFVFGVLDPAGNPLPFTVILEYRLPAATQADVDRWASDWHGLSTLTVGSPAYNAALEAITNRFAGPNAAPGRINGSSIGQVRSNEIALTAPWELREFHLDVTGQLSETPVMQTPDLSLNNSPTLASFINTNQAALLAGTHVVPLTFNALPFRAGSALTPLGHVFTAPGVVNNDARFMLSVNTCNGCHAGETGTTFLHVAPRAAGVQSVLSGFLTGLTQPDPVSGVTRSFNDLARRATAMRDQLCSITVAGAPSVTAPVNGATVSGLVTLSATVNTPATQMAFLVDGSFVGSSPVAPFNFFWNSASVPFGNHTLVAVVTAPGGATTSSAPSSFTTVPTNAPDFVVTNVQAPPNALPNSSFETQVTVCNQGNLPGGTQLTLVLSSDTAININPIPGNPALPDIVVGTAFFTLSPGQCLTQSVFANANPPGPNGRYVLAGVADLANQTAELNEGNNVNTSRVIAIGFGPDFIVTSVKGPATASPGSAVLAQVTVCNQGNSTGSSVVDLALSADAVISFPTDLQLGSSLFTLNAGECSTRAITGFANVPAAGVFFLGAIADANQTVTELDETNNTNAGQLLGIGNGPDFIITDVKGPATALPGGAFVAQVTVCNQGNAAGAAPIDLVLSPDTTLNTFAGPTNPTPDRLLSSALVTLSPTQCTTVNLSALAQPPGPNGLYFLGAIADAQGLVTEILESNNSNPGKQMNIGSGPDFVITEVKGPATALPGATITTQVTVCNQGNALATALVEVILSSDATLDLTPGPAADALVGTVSVSLGSGQCTVRSIPTFASPNGTNGAWFLGAWVDRSNTVAELNEANNTTAGKLVRIGNGPDLVITNIGGPNSALVGAMVGVPVTVCNQGNASASAGVELLLSADANLALPADVVTGFSTFTLNAGQCLTQTIVSTMNPPGVAGLYNLGAMVDRFNQLVELDETNNTNSGRVIGIGTSPDLTVTAVSFGADGGTDGGTPTVKIGTSFSTQVTVCNQGNVTAPARIDLVLSLDGLIAPPPSLPSGTFADRLVGGLTVNLIAGACSTQIVGGLATPPGSTGTYFLGAIVDVSNTVIELNETNNARAGPTILIVP